MSPARQSPGATRRDALALALLLGAIALALATTSLVYHRASIRMDAASAGITESVAPSMEDLGAVRGGAFRVGFFLAQFINAPIGDREALNAEIDESLEQLNQAVGSYAAHPELEGEAVHVQRVQRALRRLEASVEHIRALTAVGGHHDEEVRVLVAEFQPAAQEVVDAASDASQFNERAGDAFSTSMRELRNRTRETNLAVQFVSLVLIGTGVLLLRRRAINERRELEREAAALEERSSELEQFAGRVAHDIRNPMAATLTASALMLRKTEDPALRDLANRISSSMSRANKIIDGLLAFARSGAKPDPGARTLVRDAAFDLISGMRPDAEGAGIELRLEELPAVHVACSEGVFHSMLGNLVRNAIKYMGASATRKITVRGRTTGPRVRVEVADTGPGISKPDLKGVFELYFRAHGTKAEGIGLGLATVRRLAESHGGSVGVESREGVGSLFWFELPVVGQAATFAQREPPEHAEPASLH